MNKATVFSKTGKGLLEIKNKSNRLSRDQFRVLNLVDGKASLDDLVEKSRISEVELRKVLALLSDGGFIKEFTNPTAGGDYASVTIPPVAPSAAYVDDLDFTQILGPAKPTKPSIYQSAATEQRQREEAERKASEAAAAKVREDALRRSQEDNERRAREEEAARRVRAEAERRAKEEEALRQKLEADVRARLEAEKRAKEEAEVRAREKLEAEKRAKEDVERRAREESDRRAKIQAEALVRVDAERRRMQEDERKRREDEERRGREEEERKRYEEERRRKEEEERRRREEEERKRREEEERRRKEEEERRGREEEERKRREEEERKRKEEEERRRKEEEERKRKEEEERRRKEEEERRRREEEERKRREEEERKRREEEERRRREEEEHKRRAEEERRRKEEEEHRRREEEERKRKEEEEHRRQEQEDRLRKELEERHRREEEELRARLERERLVGDAEPRRQVEEEERRRREEEQERQRRADADRMHREAEEHRRRDEEQRQRREENERQRREEERARKRRAEEERNGEQQRASSAFPTLDFSGTPASRPEVSSNFDADLEALKRVEAEVEREFLAKEETIRQALEEQERRFRLEEETRIAMDRAEREAREKADREARELAEAAERTRREAEQRAREEGIRRQQEEKERRIRDQEERKKKAEEERKRRDRERREGEQRAREEALARQRAEQQERDRKKSERERLAREATKRAWGPGRIAAVAVGVLIGLVILAIQVAPLSAYAPAIEKLASDAIGEPVRIGHVHASVFPGFHLTLDGVTVGIQQDVRVPSIVAYMDLGAVLGGEKAIKTLQIEQLQATQDVLPRLPRWLNAGTSKDSRIKLQRIQFKGAKLDVKGATLPPFDAQLYLAADGTLTRVTIESTDGRLSAELFPKGQQADLTVQAKNTPFPLGLSLDLTEGQAKGVLSGNQIRLTEMDLYLYNGQVTGQSLISWGEKWTLEGEFEIKHLDLESAMKALNIDITSDGNLSAKGRYAMQSNSLESLFESPRLEVAFSVQKGDLAGLDFVRALQSPSREGIQGGKTKFDELSGNLSIVGSRYAYSNVRVTAGLLNATASGEVAANKEISGRASVELRSNANVVRGNFRILGDPKAMVLRP